MIATTKVMKFDIEGRQCLSLQGHNHT